MKLIFLDTETTGLDREKHSILQLAGTILNTQTQESETFDFHIAPYTTEPWGKGAYDTHHISEEEAAKFPSQNQVFHEFKKLLSKYVDQYDKLDKLYIVGYNVQFDVDFLYNWFKRNADPYFYSWFHYPPLDVMQLMGWKMLGKRQELENFKLATVYKYLFGTELVGAHGALSDAEATKQIMLAIFNEPLPFN